MSAHPAMRSLYAAAFLPTPFLPLATAHSTRKSLRFSHRNPTARYLTTTRSTSPAPFFSRITDSGYYIRGDPYTDRNTGTTHVYVRQRVGGIEVADGDINLNIRDGRVLSFGDLFFQGSTPSLNARPSTSHAAHCADLAGKIMTLANNNLQYVLDERPQAHEDLYALYCARPLAAVREAATTDTRKDTHDPRRAALYFMIAAHPESSAVEELTRNSDATSTPLCLPG
ncbi:Fungalysin/Thermolysin Extracellular metalloproteinase 5 [Ceratobasidium sp. 414]|nr:Fungalysin/Thermolysin Extracellular metalloproteinase 5 [Ceratobasidium sp. 414]